MRYQKIHSQIWHDETFMQLSPEAQRLFLYLLSSPHSNSIGLYVIHKMYICADLQMTIQQLKKPFDELIKNDLIMYDESVNLILIINHLKHNKIENELQAKGASKIVATLPKSKLYQEVIIQLPKHYHKPLIEALKELYAIPEEEEKEKTEEESEKEPIKKEAVAPSISVQDLMDGWNDIVATEEGFKSIAKLTEDRKKKMRLRLKAHPESDFWNKVLNKIPKVPFLSGKNDRKWRADFDFLIANDENALKIYEGKYDAEKR